MPNVKVTSFLVDGTASDQVIAVADDKRRYLMIQSQDDGGKIGIGAASDSTAYIEVGDGDTWSPAVNIVDQYRWIGDGLECVVIQDIDSNVCLSSDGLMLTYDSEPIYYNINIANRPNLLADPVFA